MHRRDRSHDDVAGEHEESAEAQAPPMPQIARVLALQRSAGNHQVAELLQRSRNGPQLQREDVEGTATFSGTQRHHPDYAFNFPGDEKQAYSFDHWFSGKTSTPTGHAATLTQQTVQDIIDDYDGSGSILDNIVTGLVGTGSMGAPDLGKLKTPGYKQEGTYDVKPEVTGAAGGPEFAAHFLTLQHNVALRVADMTNNVVRSLVVETKPRMKGHKQAPQEEKGKTHTPDWNAVLAGARRLLDAQLKSGALAPAKEKVTLGGQALAAAPGDIAKLVSMGIIDATGHYKSKGLSGKAQFEKADHKVLSQEPEFTPEGKDMLFNFGVNHIRAIIYIEWRATHELKQLAQAPQQAAVQQVAQVVQQLTAVGNGGD